MSKTPKRGEIGWAIAYKHGIYQGWWLTRRQAIETHCAETGCAWEYCQQRRGDFAVRVRIVPITGPARLKTKTRKETKRG